MSRARFLPLALLLVACGSSAAGADAPVTDAEPIGDGAPADTAVDGMPEAAPDTGPADTCAATPDLPDDLGADTNCDGVDGVVGLDVYVDPATGSDTNIGTPTKPLRGLGPAIALASSRHGHVLVAAGTFDVEKIAETGKWAIFGGYDSKFAAAPKRDQTILAVPSTGLLLDVSPEASLSHVTIQAAAASDPAARTAHGIRSRIAKLTLDDVLVIVGDGLSGEAGKAGQTGTAGANGPTGSGSATVTCAGITPALTVQVSNPASLSGDGRAAGSVADRKPAGMGGAGTIGTDGADASRAPGVVDDRLVWLAGSDGLGDGRPGYAGAGGGYMNATPGGGGSGGCPGLGGGGGTSGGGSVAVLVLAGDVKVTRSALKTGTAGRGGDGGVGGAGGAGGSGGIPTGGGISSWPGLCTPELRGPTGILITASNDPAKVNCAYYGAAGGPGGAGGHGGGGAGGWTLGVVNVGASTITVDAATTTDLGRPGDGGAGNAGGYGPAGEKHATYHL
jgi:hypothetical protein